MNRFKKICVVPGLLLAFLCLTPLSYAEQTTSYSGELWSRSTLTGDWGGFRNDLAKKGVTLDLGVTQVAQRMSGGGKFIGSDYGGRGDLILNLDTQKLGLWPGGFMTVEVEGNFDSSVNSRTGALMPVNSNQIFPMPLSDQLNITNVSVMQFFSHYIGVTVGKFATLTAHSGDMNEFAHGKGDTQFLNMALNINPVITMAVPYSTLGAGLIILPDKDPKSAIITLSALDGDGVANASGFDTVLKGNTAYVIEGRVRTDFFGLTGHQLAGAAYSTRNFTSLDQSLRFIVANRTIEQEDNTWAFYYNFDQYLYEPKKDSGRGVGIFGRFGGSDGNPNPMHYFYSIGIGGKGVIPNRPGDSFGIGYYYIDVKPIKGTGLRGNQRSFLGDGNGIEAYYSIALTPWMKLTPDIQLIRGAQKEMMTVGTREVFDRTIPNVTVKDVDAAAVLGLRLQLIF